jgi:VCBS repeat-containing protein
MGGALPAIGTSTDTETPGRCGRYIGRVGALAVALGVGVAIATGHGVGVARADDSGANDDAAAVNTSSGESAPSAADQPDVQPNPPSAAGGSPGAAGDPRQPPSTGEMKVSSSGGADTSVNDHGQSTDAGAPPPGDDGAGDDLDEDEADDGSADELDPSPPEPNTAPAAAPTEPVPALETEAAKRDSASDPVVVARHAATEVAAAQSEPVETEPESAAPAPFVARLTAAPEEVAVPEVAASDTDHQIATSFALAPAAPLAPTGAIAGFASSLVSLFLSPFIAPGPTAPAQPPLLWAVLSWVRREIHRTFFNHTPTAVVDEVSTSEDTSTTIDVAVNDVDDDGHVTVTSVTQPGNGTAVLNSDGTVTYTPNANFYGTDTFSYTITDRSSPFHVHGLLGLLTGKGHTATGTVTVTVDPVNDGAPVANSDTATVDEGDSVVIAVLANDTDPDGNSTLNPASVEVTQPAHGTVTVNADGTVTYQSNGDEVTSDSFTYTVRDDLGALSDTATVTVSIAPVNDAPVAVDDTLEVNEGGTRSIRTFLNDTDAEGNSTIVGSSVEITQPAHGVATLNPNGSVTYRSTGGPASTDSFTYTVRDSEGAISNTGTVHVNINHAPVANPDSVTTTRDTPIAIHVTANDSDPDGDSVRVVSATINLTQGDLSLEDSVIVYTPPAGQTGVFTFSYDAWDSKGFRGNDVSATVTVTVIAPPD